MSVAMPAPLGAIPHDVVCVADYARYAAARLTPELRAFVEGGAGDDRVIRRNAAAFERLALLPRVLAPVAGGHTRIRLFGHDYAHPLFLAPVASQRLLHPEGELASAAAAAAFDTPFVVTTLSSFPVEEIVAATPGAPHWFQLYFRRDRGFTLHLVRRMEAAGCQVILVTVDSLFPGVRHAARRAGFAMPDDAAYPHLVGEPRVAGPALTSESSVVFDGVMRVAPTWDDLAWLCANTRLPVVVKGVSAPDDARLALEHGAAGVLVSNHGGRAFAGAPATLDALPGVVAAVDGKAPVLFDGGVLSGEDAFKALALGATAVGVGRGYLRALAAAGPLGVAHTLKMLREELEATMAMTGCRTVADIGPHTLFRAS